MKKIAAALLLSTAIAAPAFAADSGVYVGVDAGLAYTQSPYQGTAATNTSAQSSNAGVQLGYQFDKNWGVELFYTGAGKYTGTVGTNTSVLQSDAWGVNAVGTLPVSNDFSLYARLGAASTYTRLSNSVASTFAAASRAGLTYGLGVQYNVTPAIGVRLGMDAYGLATTNAPGTATGSTQNFTSTVTSLGAVFKF